MHLAAVGDGFFWRRSPVVPDDENHRHLWRLISEADAAFVNLEGPVGHPDAYPVKQYSWGGYPYAEEWVPQQLADAGFNLVSLANNHMMNYSEPSIRANIELVAAAGMAGAGAGSCLSDARAPAYLTLDRARVALIGVDTSYEWGEFHDVQMASDARGDIRGRPGVNGVRWDIDYEVTSEVFESLRCLLRDVGRLPGNFFPQWTDAAVGSSDPAYRSSIGMGMWVPGPNDLVFIGRRFRRSNRNAVSTACRRRDLDALTMTIEDAVRNADYVIVSCHSHEGDAFNPTLPADYVAELAHACVDAGAHVFLGHGSPLKGFEVYRGRAIFYDLGKFCLEYHLSSRLPAELLEVWDLEADASTEDYFRRRAALMNGEMTPQVAAEMKLFDYGLLAEVEMRGGRLVSAGAYVLDHNENAGPERFGMPRLSDPDDAAEVIGAIEAATEQLGTRCQVSGVRVQAVIDG